MSDVNKVIASIPDPQVAALLRNGAVGILPSDTQYGVMASAHNQVAVERLYALKSRVNKLGTLIASSVEQLVDLGLKARYVKAVADLWPNPLSIVIPVGAELYYLHRGHHDLAVRIPDNAALLALLQQTGPLLTTSANKPDEPPANTIAEAQAYFADTVDFYVDGGDLSGRPPSTIIRVVDDAIEILRHGAVNIDENGRITQ